MAMTPDSRCRTCAGCRRNRDAQELAKRGKPVPPVMAQRCVNWPRRAFVRALKAVKR